MADDRLERIAEVERHLRTFLPTCAIEGVQTDAPDTEMEVWEWVNNKADEATDLILTIAREVLHPRDTETSDD